MDVVLALLTQIYDWDNGNCLFGTNELVTRFQHRKMSEPWKYFAFRPKGICNITFILVCLQASVSVGRLVTGVLLTVLHTWRMKTDASDKFSLDHSDCVPFIVNNCFFSIESSRVYLLLNGLWGKNIRMDVFRCGVDSAHSIVLQSD